MPAELRFFRLIFRDGEENTNDLNLREEDFQSGQPAAYYYSDDEYEDDRSDRPEHDEFPAKGLVYCTYRGCREFFTSFYEMKDHKRQFHDYCVRCDQDFPSFDALVEHKIYSQKHIACPHCGKDFKKEEQFKLHVELNCREMQLIICPGKQCRRKFNGVGSFFHHIENKKCRCIDSSELYDQVNKKTLCWGLLEDQGNRDFRDHDAVELVIHSAQDHGDPIPKYITDYVADFEAKVGPIYYFDWNEARFSTTEGPTRPGNGIRIPKKTDDEWPSLVSTVAAPSENSTKKDIDWPTLHSAAAAPRRNSTKKENDWLLPNSKAVTSPGAQETWSWGNSDPVQQEDEWHVAGTKKNKSTKLKKSGGFAKRPRRQVEHNESFGQTQNSNWESSAGWNESTDWNQSSGWGDEFRDPTVKMYEKITYPHAHEAPYMLRCPVPSGALGDPSLGHPPAPSYEALGIPVRKYYDDVPNARGRLRINPDQKSTWDPDHPNFNGEAYLCTNTGDYECGIKKCCFHCEKKEELMEHLQSGIHAKKLEGMCDLCNASFQTIGKRIQHLTTGSMRKCGVRRRTGMFKVLIDIWSGGFLKIIRTVPREPGPHDDMSTSAARFEWYKQPEVEYEVVRPERLY